MSLLRGSNGEMDERTVPSEKSFRVRSFIIPLSSANLLLRFRPVAPAVVQNVVPPTPSFSMPNHVVTYSGSVRLPSLPNLSLQSFDGKGCWETFLQGFSEIIDKRLEIGDSTKGELRGGWAYLQI